MALIMCELGDRHWEVLILSETWREEKEKRYGQQPKATLGLAAVVLEVREVSFFFYTSVGSIRLSRRYLTV